ncbi:polyphosphate kinase 2 family protein [Longimicrobium sp.]|uniref:polyphosphate kinase 2 family protein n=1 Tax=Longimicrobium sp. TaxID=2029185 RepID=UPI002E30284C|nr:polyphosphate kinase 2 family protein [Longimicrobium sp.]HEX6037313.1 polyphosphate kinase 2 family protein [Longimicrobium sp.]
MPYTHRVTPGSHVKLKDHDAGETAGLDKAAGHARFAELNAELDTLQEEMYAAGRNSVLMILQGMDTSGKDGAIRAVMANLNPQGCRVESFKVPTEHELAHDFLWRVHRVTPELGMFGVFNRSHYEDVLVVRVHDLVPRDVWKQRYEQINAFESLLAANGTIVLKFFLHISRKEQEERLLAREQELGKAWKLSAGDWREREHWDAYQEAYEDALSRCSTDVAPWYVVPANRKWFRNLAITETLVETLRPYRPSWKQALEEMSRARLAELAAYRSQRGG